MKAAPVRAISQLALFDKEGRYSFEHFNWLHCSFHVRRLSFWALNVWDFVFFILYFYKTQNCIKLQSLTWWRQLTRTLSFYVYQQTRVPMGSGLQGFGKKNTGLHLPRISDLFFVRAPSKKDLGLRSSRPKFGGFRARKTPPPFLSFSSD